MVKRAPFVGPSCNITLHQYTPDNPEFAVATYKVKDSYGDALYIGMNLTEEGRDSKLDGWSVEDDKYKNDFASSVHAALTAFDAEHKTCMMVNCSRRAPVFVTRPYLADGPVFINKNDRRAVIVETLGDKRNLVFFLHLTKG